MNLPHYIFQYVFLFNILLELSDDSGSNYEPDIEEHTDSDTENSEDGSSSPAKGLGKNHYHITFNPGFFL